MKNRQTMEEAPKPAPTRPQSPQAIENRRLRKIKYIFLKLCHVYLTKLCLNYLLAKNN